MGAVVQFRAETPQQRADRMLREWQQQRQRGVKPEYRLDAHDEFERDLEILRQIFARSE